MLGIFNNFKMGGIATLENVSENMTYRDVIASKKERLNPSCFVKYLSLKKRLFCNHRIFISKMILFYSERQIIKAHCALLSSLRKTHMVRKKVALFD